MASFWVPDLFNLINKKNSVVDPVKHVYTNILERFKRDKTDPYDSSNEKALAEIVITPDNLTNGFLEDS